MMKTHMNPKFRQWCEKLMLKLFNRNSSVVRNWQNEHALVASGFVRYPPFALMYGCRYCEHVSPEGGVSCTSSTDEQLMSYRPMAEPGVSCE